VSGVHQPSTYVLYVFYVSPPRGDSWTLAKLLMPAPSKTKISILLQLGGAIKVKLRHLIVRYHCFG